ncbi:hypothetical protein A9HBioS_5657 [Pseudomonas koreensis]|uniref:Uncharacterized protein n=1 Tax=Pseudomonas koreensis TaxID=198620 RepID=A0AA94JEN0_9PSED|nr:hypothetical protein A9HBioS_5657 [Pseudomonas koreensis]
MGHRVQRRAHVKDVLEALSAPGKHEHGEDDPRHPRTHHRRARLIAERGAGGDFFFLDPGVVDATCKGGRGVHRRRFPDPQKQGQAGHGNQRGNHVHQHWAVVVRHEELRHREANPGYQNRRPDFEHLAPPGKCPDQPERHQHREKWQLPTDHHRQLHLIQPGDLGQGDDRCAERAERHRGGVGNQRQTGRGQRRKTEADQNRPGHRHRCAEPGRAFKKRTEAEGDQQQLQTAVVGDPRQ